MHVGVCERAYTIINAFVAVGVVRLPWAPMPQRNDMSHSAYAQCEWICAFYTVAIPTMPHSEPTHLDHGREQGAAASMPLGRRSQDSRRRAHTHRLRVPIAFVMVRRLLSRRVRPVSIVWACCCALPFGQCPAPCSSIPACASMSTFKCTVLSATTPWLSVVSVYHCTLCVCFNGSGLYAHRCADAADRAP